MKDTSLLIFAFSTGIIGKFDPAGKRADQKVTDSTRRVNSSSTRSRQSAILAFHSPTEQSVCCTTTSQWVQRLDDARPAWWSRPLTSGRYFLRWNTPLRRPLQPRNPHTHKHRVAFWPSAATGSSASAHTNTILMTRTSSNPCIFFSIFPQTHLGSTRGSKDSF